MKKGINVIQIKGTKGVILAIGIVCCLIAGFVAFPGWVCMITWNLISTHIDKLPLIGIFQGILLWGIIIASYYIFRKEKHVTYLRAPLEGLSEEELKEVFADIKKQVKDDPLLQNIIKAKEAELRIKNLNDMLITNPNIKKTTTKDVETTVSEENKEQVQQKIDNNN